MNNAMNFSIKKLGLNILTGLSVMLFSFNAQAANQTVTIGALVSGQVSKVYIEEGQQVKQGQKLLTLDSSRYQAKLTMLNAQMKVAKLALDDAQVEYDQAVDLYDRTVTSKRTFDAAQLQFEQAKATFEQAKAEVLLHKSWAKYVYVKAPVSGKINKIFTPAGSTVYKENTPMIEMQP